MAEAGDFQLEANWHTQGNLVSKAKQLQNDDPCLYPSTGEAESDGSLRVQASQFCIAMAVQLGYTETLFQKPHIYI